MTAKEVRTTRQQLDRYRAAARRLVPNGTVSPVGYVHPMADGGAYVEVMVFVREEDLDPNVRVRAIYDDGKDDPV